MQAPGSPLMTLVGSDCHRPTQSWGTSLDEGMDKALAEVYYSRTAHGVQDPQSGGLMTWAEVHRCKVGRAARIAPSTLVAEKVVPGAQRRQLAGALWVEKHSSAQMLRLLELVPHWGVEHDLET